MWARLCSAYVAHWRNLSPSAIRLHKPELLAAIAAESIEIEIGAVMTVIKPWDMPDIAPK